MVWLLGSIIKQSYRIVGSKYNKRNTEEPNWDVSLTQLTDGAKRTKLEEWEPEADTCEPEWEREDDESNRWVDQLSRTVARNQMNQTHPDDRRSKKLRPTTRAERERGIANQTVPRRRFTTDDWWSKWLRSTIRFERRRETYGARVSQPALVPYKFSE